MSRFPCRVCGAAIGKVQKIDTPLVGCLPAIGAVSPTHCSISLKCGYSGAGSLPRSRRRAIRANCILPFFFLCCIDDNQPYRSGNGHGGQLACCGRPEVGPDCNRWRKCQLLLEAFPNTEQPDPFPNSQIGSVSDLPPLIDPRKKG